MRNTINTFAIKKFMLYEDLKKMKPTDRVLVSRMVLYDKIMEYCMQGKTNPELWGLLHSYEELLTSADDVSNCPVFGIEIDISEIKRVFTKEDFEKHAMGFCMPKRNATRVQERSR